MVQERRINMDQKETFGKKALNFIKDNRYIIGGTILGTVAVTAYMYHKGKFANLGGVSEVLSGDEYARTVDRLIFTDLAPKLEEVVLDKGIDTFNQTNIFDLGDGIQKTVTTVMETINN